MKLEKGDLIPQDDQQPNKQDETYLLSNKEPDFVHNHQESENLENQQLSNDFNRNTNEEKTQNHIAYEQQNEDWQDRDHAGLENNENQAENFDDENNPFSQQAQQQANSNLDLTDSIHSTDQNEMNQQIQHDQSLSQLDDSKEEMINGDEQFQNEQSIQDIDHQSRLASGSELEDTRDNSDVIQREKPNMDANYDILSSVMPAEMEKDHLANYTELKSKLISV